MASAAYQSMSLSSLQAELAARLRRSVQATTKTATQADPSAPKLIKDWSDPELWCWLHPSQVQPPIPSGGPVMQMPSEEQAAVQLQAAAHGFLVWRQVRAARVSPPPGAVVKQQLQDGVSVDGRACKEVNPAADSGHVWLPGKMNVVQSCCCSHWYGLHALGGGAIAGCMQACRLFLLTTTPSCDLIYTLQTFPWEPGQVAASRIKGCNSVNVLIIVTNKISRDVQGLIVC
jgi:hypothetical protein